MDFETSSTLSPILIEQIEKLIWARTGGCVRDLRVQVRGRNVTLSGRTDSYYNKQLATHAVLNEIDDIRLKNEIEVR